MPDEIAERLRAALADRYRIERELGAGGMASVYLAQDLRHDRRVAIKVLRPELSATVGPDRFLQEIRIAARLSHPHILPLFDSGRAGESLFYVMPFAEGATLRHRLQAGGRLPVDEAVRILRDVADALASAHEHGVVHRDIKPENVMLDGRHALVADFGVAKAVSDATGAHALTSLGMALGTPAYMAPEQIAADPTIDGRADVYALGVMAYEMLAGAHPFGSVPPQQLMAAHLTQQPAKLATVRPGVPEELSELVGQCLAKSAAERPAGAAEVLARLEAIAAAIGVSGPHPPRKRRRTIGALKGLAVVALVLTVGALILERIRMPSNAAVDAMVRVTSDLGLELYPDLSPDGNQLAYAAGSSADLRVFVRPVDGERAIRLTSDSTNEWQPRWSLDGSRILFVTAAGVVTTPPTGGAPRIVVAAPQGRFISSAAWSPDGSEVAWSMGDSVYASPVGGGAARAIGGAREVHACSWSRGGRWIACAAENAIYSLPGALLGNTSAAILVLFPARGGPATRLTDSTSLNDSPAWGRRDDELYFVSNRQNTRDIYVLHLNRSGRVSGSVERLTSGVSVHTIGIAANGGRIAYSAYSTSSNLWSVDLPAPGRTRAMSEAVAITRGNQTVESMSVSRDGRWLLFDSDRSGTADIYRMRLPDGEPERLTSDAGGEFKPDLSPDGRFLAYHSLRSGSRDIFVKPLDGGALQRVTTTGQHEARPAWSPDGQSIAFVDLAVPRSVWIVHRQGAGWGTPRLIEANDPTENVVSVPSPDWSPDGREIAYAFFGSLHVAPAGAGRPRTIYTPVASQGDPTVVLAQWGRDGRLIYFRGFTPAGVNGIWSVSVTGGRPQLVMRFDDPARPVQRIEFTVDARHLYFPVADRASDLWVATVGRR